MKYFPLITCACVFFCCPAIAEDADGIPSPSLVSTTTTYPGGDLPWKHGNSQSASQQGNSSSSSSSSSASVSSTAQDIQDTTQSLSDSVQGTAQNINNMRNSVSSLKNGGNYNGGAIPMTAYPQLAPAYGAPAQQQMLQQQMIQQQAIQRGIQAQPRVAGNPAQQMHLANPSAPLTPAQQRAWALMRAHPGMAQQMRNQQLVGQNRVPQVPHVPPVRPIKLPFQLPQGR